MRLVHDVHLVVSLTGRGVHGALTQVAGIVDAAIGRGIDFHHVQPGRAGPDAATVVADTAGFARRFGFALPLAVERHGEDAGGRGLSDAAWSGEQIAVADPILDDRTAQHSGYMILDEEVAEASGAVFSSEGEGHDGKVVGPAARRLDVWEAPLLHRDESRYTFSAPGPKGAGARTASGPRR